MFVCIVCVSVRVCVCVCVCVPEDAEINCYLFASTPSGVLCVGTCIYDSLSLSLFQPLKGKKRIATCRLQTEFTTATPGPSPRQPCSATDCRVLISPDLRSKRQRRLPTVRALFSGVKNLLSDTAIQGPLKAPGQQNISQTLVLRTLLQICISNCSDCRNNKSRHSYSSRRNVT